MILSFRFSSHFHPLNLVFVQEWCRIHLTTIMVDFEQSGLSWTIGPSRCVCSAVSRMAVCCAIGGNVRYSLECGGVREVTRNEQPKVKTTTTTVPPPAATTNKRQLTRSERPKVTTTTAPPPTSATNKTGRCRKRRLRIDKERTEVDHLRNDKRHFKTHPSHHFCISQNF